MSKRRTVIRSCVFVVGLIVFGTTISGCSHPAATDDGQGDASLTPSEAPSDSPPAANLAEDQCGFISGADIANAYLVGALGDAVRSDQLYSETSDCNYWWSLPPGSANIVLGHAVTDDPSGMGVMVFVVREFSDASASPSAGLDVAVNSPADLLGPAQESEFAGAYSSANNVEFTTPGLGGFCTDNSECFVALDDRYWVSLTQTLDNNRATQEALVRVAAALVPVVASYNR